jgi:hypothetical protein
MILPFFYDLEDLLIDAPAGGPVDLFSWGDQEGHASILEIVTKSPQLVHMLVTGDDATQFLLDIGGHIFRLTSKAPIQIDLLV